MRKLNWLENGKSSMFRKRGALWLKEQIHSLGALLEPALFLSVQVAASDLECSVQLWVLWEPHPSLSQLDPVLVINVQRHNPKWHTVTNAVAPMGCVLHPTGKFQSTWSPISMGPIFMDSDICILSPWAPHHMPFWRQRGALLPLHPKGPPSLLEPASALWNWN